MSDQRQYTREQLDPLAIDLSDLEIAEIETLVQEGAQGLPDFAASCSSTNPAGTSCGGSPAEEV